MARGPRDATTVAAVLLVTLWAGRNQAETPAPPAPPAPAPSATAPYVYPQPNPYPYPYPYPYPQPPPHRQLQPPPPQPPTDHEPPPSPATPADATQLDPLLPTGITATSLGALLTLGGGLLLGSAEGDEICGVLGGCVTRPDPAGELAGGAMLGAGLGLIALGLPTLILGVGEVPRDGYRTSHGMTAAGVVLTAAAAGLVGSGVGALAADGGRGGLDEGEVFIPLFAVGGAFALVGVPLWAVGAQSPVPGTARSGRRP